jgi:hypothetical protein
MRWLCVILLFFSADAMAQCKTFKIGVKGDTLNCTDVNGNKRGKWINRIESVRGEPGYEEEGLYADGKKEGIWRIYTLDGDLYAIERYRWGNKDGFSQYYNIGGIIREESWKAVNPVDPWDTIEVIDPVDPTKVEMKRIRLEGTAMKHGTWKFYEPGSGSLVRTEKWFLDKLEDPNAFGSSGKQVSDTTVTTSQTTTKPKPKPKEVEAFEKKNAGKKKIKVRDGRTGG